MKKTITRLIGEADGRALEVKVLRKAACKLHLEIEDKEERKQAFADVLNSLESKGRIVLENSVAKLVDRAVAAVDEAIVVEVIKKKEKKRKINTVDTDESEILQAADKEVTKTKKSKKLKESIPDVCANQIDEAATVQAGSEGDSSAPTKKEYPPIEVQTGNNTILLFYAYCTPIMSRGQ